MSENNGALFHLAFPVHDLEAARDFYGRVLGCPEGRSSDTLTSLAIRSSRISSPAEPAWRSQTQWMGETFRSLTSARL
jgi:extradiol dioxygenase family protein